MYVKKIKKRVEKKIIILIIFFSIFILLLFSLLFHNKSFIQGDKSNNISKIFQKNKTENLNFRKNIFLAQSENLKNSGCISLKISEEKKCNLKIEKISECLENTFFISPQCLVFDTFHVKRPEKVRAVYFSSYGASRSSKIKQLIDLVKKTEVNSVIIDIKEINGEVYFIIPTENFDKIQPEFDVILRNPKNLLEKLHSHGIYIIGRIVLFKDENLAKRRPDLAVKKSDKEIVWQDYRKKTWVDPGSQDVWDYNLEIARQAYLIGFDEINLDYVRFPSDGPMFDIYYPFSQKEIDSDKKWGRAKIMDRFYHYFTYKLREEFPDIKISASIFGQVALNHNDVTIGQILASTLLYFDNVAPMAYPSHYHKNFGNFVDGPDNHPFEVIDKTLKVANIKIDKLNKEISFAQKNNKKVKIRENFYANISAKDMSKVDYSKIRLWLQAFNCTWCGEDYKIYNKEEIWAQEDAVYKNYGDSWMLWNASSRYKNDFFKKK